MGSNNVKLFNGQYNNSVLTNVGLVLQVTKRADLEGYETKHCVVIQCLHHIHVCSLISPAAKLLLDRAFKHPLYVPNKPSLMRRIHASPATTCQLKTVQAAVAYSMAVRACMQKYLT